MTTGAYRAIRFAMSETLRFNHPGVKRYTRKMQEDALEWLFLSPAEVEEFFNKLGGK